MKYLILRCEDDAKIGKETASLLKGAKTAYLHQIAQSGAAGLIKKRGLRQAIDPLAVHRGLLGFNSNESELPGGSCYAASVNVHPAGEETVWCCDFVTAQDGVIVDTTAGQISTKESAVLLQALGAELGSDSRRWEVGFGSRHLFVTRDEALRAGRATSMPAADVLLGQPWKKHVQQDSLGDALQLLMDQAAAVLEGHPVNRVRVDLGENPANRIWLWGGASSGHPETTFTQRTGLEGALVGSYFPLRGMAKSLQVEWKQGPASFEEPALQQLAGELNEMAKRYDLIYATFRVTSSDPVDRLCAMERIDQVVLKPLAEGFNRLGPWRQLTVVDDKADGSMPFIASGHGLPAHSVSTLHGDGIMESDLLFEDSAALFSWFTQNPA